MSSSDDQAPTLSEVPATVDALLLHTGPSLARQYGVADALDSKAIGILAVSGAVITIAGFSGADESWIGDALTFLAVTTWFVVAAMVIRQMWTVTFTPALSPDRWYDRRFYETEAVKSQLLEEASEAYARNRILNEEKARSVRVALVGTIIETALIAIVVVLDRL